MKLIIECNLLKYTKFKNSKESSEFAYYLFELLKKYNIKASSVETKLENRRKNND